MIRRAGMLLIVGVALFAQGDSKLSAESGTSLDQRLAVIETKLDNLKTLDDRVSKLNDKINALNLQLAAVNTKLEIIQWIGGAVGVLVLGSLYNSLTQKRNSSDEASRNSMIRSEVARVLALHSPDLVLPEEKASDVATPAELKEAIAAIKRRRQVEREEH